MTIERDAAAAAPTARFGRDATVTLATAMFSRGGVLLLQVGAARLLGVVAFNVFVTATIVGAVVYLLSDLGLRQAVIVSAAGDEGLARRAAAALRSVRRKAALPIAALGAVAVAVLASTDGEHALAGALIVLSYAVQSYSRYLRSPLRAGARVVAESKLEWLERAATLIGAGAGLLARSLVWSGVGALAGALLGLFVTQRSLRLQAGDAPVAFTRSPVRYGMTLSAAVAASMVYARLDYVVLLRIGSQLDAAVYAATYTLVLAFSMLYVAVSDTAYAHLPGNAAARGPYLRLVTVAGGLGFLTIGTTGPALVRTVFGLDHPSLGPLCWLLGVASAVMAVTSTVGVFAPMEGRERRMTALSALAAGVNVGLCLVLIPSLGVIGGALATIATESVGAIGWWAWRRKAGSVPNEPPRAVPLPASAS